MIRSIILKVFVGVLLISSTYIPPTLAQSETAIQMNYLGTAKGMRFMKSFGGGNKLPKSIKKSPLSFEWNDRYHLASNNGEEDEDKFNNVSIKYVHDLPNKKADSVLITIQLKAKSNQEWNPTLAPINVRGMKIIKREDLSAAGLREIMVNELPAFYKSEYDIKLRGADITKIEDRFIELMSSRLIIQIERVRGMRKYAAGKSREVAANVMNLGLKGRERRKAARMERTMASVFQHSMKARDFKIQKVDDIDELDIDDIKYMRTLKEGNDEIVYEVLTETERIQVSQKNYKVLQERRRIS